MQLLVFDKNTRHNQFTNCGYGRLKLVKSCKVVEELNGHYDVEVVIQLADEKVQYVKKWAILRVEGQLFRVSHIKDNSREQTRTAFAKHIFYDLHYGFVEDRRAHDSKIDETLTIARPEGFEYFEVIPTDIEEAQTIYFVKNNGVLSVFETIERFGAGELVRDNFKYGVVSSKGRDKGVSFTYKKIDAIEVSEDTEEIVTRLYPTGKDGVSLQEKYVYIPNWSEVDYLPFHITREVKFEQAENEGDLRILAQKEAQRIGLAKKHFSISVHDLLKTELYKEMPALMDVEVGDVVTIKHPKLEVRVKTKVIKKETEVVSGKTRIELGDPLGNFFDSLANQVGGGSVTAAQVSSLRNELFYYFNGAEMTLKTSEMQLASMRIATSVQTNLMCHLSLNPKVEVAGLLQLKITINNEELQYSPMINLPIGYSVQTISFPFIAVEGGQTHVVKVWGVFDGLGLIEMNRLHFSITGQNVAMGLIKIEPFTGVNVEYCLDIIHEGYEPKITFNATYTPERSPLLTRQYRILETLTVQEGEIPNNIDMQGGMT